jgi:hypothetical protein
MRVQAVEFHNVSPFVSISRAFGYSGIQAFTCSLKESAWGRYAQQGFNGINTWFDGRYNKRKLLQRYESGVNKPFMSLRELEEWSRGG